MDMGVNIDHTGDDGSSLGVDANGIGSCQAQDFLVCPQLENSLVAHRHRLKGTAQVGVDIVVIHGDDLGVVNDEVGINDQLRGNLLGKPG